jgi:peptidoglycan hydrolase-like protein with peptidoglycan-binding domain
MDQMVLSVQQWLNNTYMSNINYTTIPEDGITGGGTVAALITALQIELHISSPDGIFGTATMSACHTLPSSSATKNEVYILQGALYCKGYNPNGLDGLYGNGVMTAIKKFQSDAGLIVQDGITTPMIFQALLNTEAFVLIYGGDTNIRTIQQRLNRDYNSIIGLIPCDGIYSRLTNKALIKALQHEEGNTTDGIFGTDTMNLCPTIPGINATTNFILLLQYALYCNHFNPNGFDGLFGPGLQTAIINFQTFACLAADGYAGPQTWASLLVSTGDPNRKGEACDCSTTINDEIAKTLADNDYEAVGRYLTGSFKMTVTELETIYGYGIKVFPIFETAGTQSSYFTEVQGGADAVSASTAADSLSFLPGAIIYFAVDYDAIDYEVTNYILPYFKAINDEFSTNGYGYKVGIYGPRNVCSRVASAGYSCSSFICDMSSGFSGNLGYSLPIDWAFDQIQL